ncbi:MAG: hypothetical protein K0Q57_303, partial [Gammaproteobacteria bacterium]|nr:hypothetical protein [Gammaproteobacteria bacterium]
LICVPALIAAGLPAASVLATNKLQACFGSGTAATRLMQYSRTPLKEVWLGCLFCLAGATAGSLCVMLINPDLLQHVLPALLAVVLLYSLFSARISSSDHPARIPSSLFMIIFGLALGFYDGFFGPGTGSFWVIAIVFFLGYNLQRATIHAKVYNFISNIIALAWFIIGGHVIYSVGLIMAAGQFIGAHIGAKLVMAKGAKLIRPIFISMATLMLIVVIYKTYY